MTINREEWLTQAADLISNTIILPAIEDKRVNVDTDFKLSVSIGHPKSKNAIGECWIRDASEDKKTNHVFITPHCNDSVRILDVLTHELLHAYDDCRDGHKGRFALLARAVGLEGKLTATVAGDVLREKLLDIVDVLRDIPHTKLDESLGNKPKQKARMLSVLCEPCDFRFSASRTQLDRLIRASTAAQCMCCGSEIEESIYAALNK
jgi:hypothetical protein